MTMLQLVLFFGKIMIDFNVNSMFEVAYLLGAPFIGSSLKKIGRKNYIIIGYLIIVIGTAGFGTLSFVSDR